MQGRRILIFAVVFLITLPIVTATADGAEKSADEGMIVRLGELHEGERFVYDLHLTSKYRELDVHVPEYFDITIGRDRAFEALDGSVHDVLVARSVKQAADWSPIDLEWGGEATNRTQYLRVEDGVYVERLEQRRQVEWSEEDGRSRSDHRNQVNRIEGDANGGDMFGRGIHPGSVYVNGNMLQQIAASMIMRTNGLVSEVGTWHGETVFDVLGHGWTQTGTGTQFRCDLVHPEYDYTDFADDEMAARLLREEYMRRAWVQPGIAFPVLNECHATYQDGSELVEEIRLALELTHHEEGGAEIPVRWDRMNQHDNFAPDGALAAAPTPWAGVPPQGGALGVPLADAVALVAGLDEPELVEWRDEGDVPFYLVSASYRPDVQLGQPASATPAGSVPNPTPFPLPNPSLPPDPTQPTEPGEQPEPEQTRVAVLWDLGLANVAGETWNFRLRFNETSPGVFETGRVEWIDPGNPEDPLVDGRLADRLVPLEALIERFVADAAPAPGWVEHALSSISIRNTIIDDGDMGYRAYHTIRFMAEDPGASSEDPGNAYIIREYDTRDGAPLQAGRSENWVVEDAPRPAQPGYSTASADAPAVAARFPTAATASGLALAVGFVAAFFWDAIARTFGQFVGAPLYAKIRKDKVLDHRTRDLLVTTVAENPGIAVEELRREVAVGYGTVCHHLDTLQRNGLVTSRKVGRRRCYFVPGAVDANAMAAVGVAGTKAATRLIEIVVAEPGLTQSEIAERLGVADSSVRYQAKRLLAHERLRAEREGRTVRYYPGEPAAA